MRHKYSAKASRGRGNGNDLRRWNLSWALRDEDVGQQPFQAEELLGVKGLASAHLSESVISWYPGA